MSWGIRIEGKSVRRKRSLPLGGYANEFVIGLFTENKEQFGANFLSTRAIQETIQYRKNLQNQRVGEITVELSEDRKVGTFQYTEPLLIHLGKGLARVLMIKSAIELHQKVPELEFIQLERRRIHITEIIAHFRRIIERDQFRYGNARKRMTKEQRIRVRRSIATRRRI